LRIGPSPLRELDALSSSLSGAVALGTPPAAATLPVVMIVTGAR